MSAVIYRHGSRRSSYVFLKEAMGSGCLAICRPLPRMDTMVNGDLSKIMIWSSVDFTILSFYSPPVFVPT